MRSDRRSRSGSSRSAAARSARIWGLIAAVIGLAQTQETTTGKSAAAVLTPTVLCCGLAGVFSTILVAMMAMLAGRATGGS